MRFEVLITERARRDLEQARAYIAKHAPEAAERWYVGFLKALLDLEKNPTARPFAAENPDFPFELREFLYRSRSGSVSRALFTIVRQEVRVLAIRRPGQDLVTREDLV
jgi:plasmid stabilization system protein ParE